MFCQAPRAPPRKMSLNEPPQHRPLHRKGAPPRRETGLGQRAPTGEERARRRWRSPTWRASAAVPALARSRPGAGKLNADAARRRCAELQAAPPLHARGGDLETDRAVHPVDHVSEASPAQAAAHQEEVVNDPEAPRVSCRRRAPSPKRRVLPEAQDQLRAERAEDASYRHPWSPPAPAQKDHVVPRQGRAEGRRRLTKPKGRPVWGSRGGSASQVNARAPALCDRKHRVVTKPRLESRRGLLPAPQHLSRPNLLIHASGVGRQDGQVRRPQLRRTLSAGVPPSGRPRRRGNITDDAVQRAAAPRLKDAAGDKGGSPRQPLQGPLPRQSRRRTNLTETAVAQSRAHPHRPF